jgi:hypothetical protein
LVRILGGGGSIRVAAAATSNPGGGREVGRAAPFFFPVRLLVGGERTGGEPGSVLAIVRVFAILVVVAR